MKISDRCDGNISNDNISRQTIKFRCVSDFDAKGWSIRNDINASSNTVLLTFYNPPFPYYTDEQPNNPRVTFVFDKNKNTIAKTQYSYTDKNINGYGSVRINSICYGNIQELDPVNITVSWTYGREEVVYNFTINKLYITNITATIAIQEEVINCQPIETFSGETFSGKTFSGETFSGKTFSGETFFDISKEAKHKYNTSRNKDHNKLHCRKHKNN
jgi:hypothetical protein